MSQLAPPPPPPAARHTRPSRVQVVTALGAIAALIGGAVVAIALVNRHVTTPPQPSQARSAATHGGVATEDALLTAIITDGLTPARAEELFALDVGPLPGVSVTGIKPANSFDGSTAVMYLYAEWGQLTKTQQQVATRLITTSTAKATSAGAGSATVSAAEMRASVRTLSTAPRGQRSSPIRLLATQVQNPQNIKPAFDYGSLVEQANSAEATDTGTPEIANVVVQISNELDGSEYASTSLYANFAPPNHPAIWQTWSDGCRILVRNPRFQELGQDADSAAAVIAHEMFHCYIDRAVGSGGNQVTLSPWVFEGEPTWVMNELHPGAAIETGYWAQYGISPFEQYNLRWYDGVGVFGHQGDVIGDQAAVWPKLLPMVVANIGGHDKAVLSMLIGGDSDHYYNSWGASYFQDSPPDWHMVGPGTPPTSSAPGGSVVAVSNGDNKDIASSGQYQATRVTITGNADIVVVVLASGYGEIHDEGYNVNQTLSTSSPLALCLKSGGCKCPDGSPGASEHTIPATGPISVGLDGGDTGLAAYARGDSLDKYCKQPDQPPPGESGGPSSPGGGGGSGETQSLPPPPAQSVGDPHLLTFNHRWYDLQAVGEFTLVKSTVDDFVVQTRTAPLPGSTTIAVNVAVATTLGGHRLTLALQNGTIIVRVDGVIESHEFFSLGAGTVERLGTEVGAGYVVEWPDSTRMRVDQLSIQGLNVSIWPAASRAGQLVGLLGNDNGQASSDFVTANGVDLGSTPPPATIHGQFADSWRLSQAASLFDYGPGQSTATFTDRTFPHAFVDASRVPNTAKATQACQGEGITDTGLLADCVIDDAEINDQSVLTHYAQAQVVLTVASNIANNLPPFSGLAGARPSPTPTPPSGGQGVLVDSGAVTSAGEDQVFTFPANAGDIIWFGSPGCDNGGLSFALRDPQGRPINSNNENAAQGLLCQDTRFVLPTSGMYQLVANADFSRTGQYSVSIQFERHDQVFQTSYGQTISGYIPDVATHDVYVFTAQAGDVVHISGSGCNVASYGSAQQSSPIDVSLDDSAGKGIIGLDCTPNSNYSIQSTATYEIVVNEPEHGPGSYEFVIQK